MARSQWPVVHQHCLRRKGRSTGIYLHGERYPWKKAWKEIRRCGANAQPLMPGKVFYHIQHGAHGACFVNLYAVSNNIDEDHPGQLPLGVEVRTPSPGQPQSPIPRLYTLPEQERSHTISSTSLSPSLSNPVSCRVLPRRTPSELQRIGIVHPFSLILELGLTSSSTFGLIFWAIFRQSRALLYYEADTPLQLFV